MLLKLIAFVVMAHQINACCLPESFQVTVLSETIYGDYRYRSRIVMAGDAYQGRAAVFSFSEDGQTSVMYANVNTRKAHVFSPQYGCFEMPIDENMLRQLNESKCVPPHLLDRSPIRLTIAEGPSVNFLSGNVAIGGGGGNSSNSTGAPAMHIDAIVTDSCKPVLVKLNGPSFASVNIFGDFRSQPLPGLLDLPPQCTGGNNGTGGGNGTAGARRRRGAVTLGFGTSPFVL